MQTINLIPLQNKTRTPMRVREPWLLLVRVAWLALALGSAVLFVMGLTPRYRDVLTTTYFIQRDWIPEAALPASFYPVYLLTIGIVIALVFYVVAAIIFWLKSDERMGIFVAFFFIALGITAPQPVWALAFFFPEYRVPVELLSGLSVTTSVIFLYLFPNGEFVPRWTRTLAVLWIVWNLGVVITRASAGSSPVAGEQTGAVFTAPFFLNEVPLILRYVFILSWLATGIYAQVYRYRRMSDPTQRQQTRWVVFGAVGGFGMYLAINLLFVLVPQLRVFGLFSVVYDELILPFGIMASVLIPITTGVSMLRFRLWDLDPIVNRTIVYGALTLIIIALYVAIVGGFGLLLQQTGNFLISLIVTGLIAILFQPLREHLQRAVNRLMYGERDDPYRVLSTLGQRLEATLAPSAVLPSIVESVAQAMKLPYAAIALKQRDAFEIAAAYGNVNALTDESSALEIPLTYQRDTIGKMILAPRSRDETFSPSDLRLLNDLAREAGVAAHAVRLTADLQKSRERIVTTREEERRRLRRDLHDGLGPSLASMNLQLEALRNVMRQDSNAANQMISDLQSQTQTAITDVRRLVYELRPPALDDLGLVSALRQHAARASQADGLQITIDAPDALPLLPAAVEVVAYRIALEAMTNVVKHSRAKNCVVTFRLDDALQIEVTDDGVGIGSDRHAGVGLISMRERAEELGGMCAIVPNREKGTRVVARLPLPKE